MKRRFHTFSLILVFVLLSTLMPKYQAFGDTDGFTNGIGLVSVSSTGQQGNGDSNSASVSRDGRFVAFESDASNLVPGGTNYNQHIYVVDRQSKVVQCVSVSNDGVQGNGFSSGPCISDDGSFIAFTSDSDNLVPGDNNGSADVFVYDRLNNKIEIVSISNEGHLGTGGYSVHSVGSTSISSNGRFVVFASDINNLVPGDNDDNCDTFIYDRQDKKIERVGVNSSEGFVGTGYYSATSISGDGRLIVFDSTLDNLVEGDSNGKEDVFIYDRITKEIKRISIPCYKEQGIGGGSIPSISKDGKFVVFISRANDLVPDDTDNNFDIFLYDVQNMSIQRIMYDINESIDHYSPDISEDGRYVVCQSGQNSNWNYILVYDRMNNRSHNVTISYDGDYPNNHSYYPKISSDGQFIVFYSKASNLIENDSNSRADVFIAKTVLLDPEPIPQLIIQSPLQGENISIGKKTITATASEITLDHIYVYLTDNAGNEIPVGTQPGNSFSMEYDFQQPGSYSINAVGSTTPNRTDPGNQVIYAQSINVTVTGEMNIKYTKPENNKSFVVGEKIDFGAIASGLKYVQFFYKNVDNPDDWGQIGSDFIDQTDCNVTWDTSGKAAGRYYIKVQGVNEPNQLSPLCYDEMYINLNPSVTIESPVSNDPLNIGEHKITVSAAGSMFDHIFVSIKNSNDEEVYGVTKDGNNFDDNYNFSTPGKYTIYATGKLSVPDKNGNSLIPATPIEVTVTAGGPVSLAITSPDEGTFPAGKITVKVEGNNCDHIYVYGKKPKGEFFAIGTQYTNHFSKDWDFLDIGTYTIYASATNGDPNAEPVYAKEVSINVIPAPEIKITALNGNRIESGKPIEIVLGKPIEIELNAKNCDHISININNGLLDKNIKCTSNDFSYKYEFTPSSVGQYKITVAGRNTPNENDPGTKRVEDEIIVSVVEKLPDLVVTNIDWTPAEGIMLGDRVQFVATVENRGEGATPNDVPIEVDFYVDGVRIVWSSYHIAPLPKGKSIIIRSDNGLHGDSYWRAVLGDRGGLHSVEARIDIKNKISESNENNNIFPSSNDVKPYLVVSPIISYMARYGYPLINTELAFSYPDNYEFKPDRYVEVFGAAGRVAYQVNKGEWAGNCFGMALSSSMFYNKILSASDFDKTTQDVNQIYDKTADGKTKDGIDFSLPALNLNNKLTSLTERYQIYQYSSEAQIRLKMETDMYNKLKGGGYIQYIIDKIKNTNFPLIFALNYSDGVHSGGHAVVRDPGRKIEDMGNGWLKVYVYDPIYPFFSNPKNIKLNFPLLYPYKYYNQRYIEFNPTKNIWQYAKKVDDKGPSDFIGYYKDGVKIGESMIRCVDFGIVDLSRPSSESFIPDTNQPYYCANLDEIKEATIYNDAGLKVCDISRGNINFINDSVVYMPYLNYSFDENSINESSINGTLILPKDNYSFGLEGSGNISLAGDNHFININCAGSLKFDVDTSTNAIKVISGVSDSNQTDITIANIEGPNDFSSITLKRNLERDEILSARLDDNSVVRVESNYAECKLDAVLDNDDLKDGILLNNIYIESINNTNIIQKANQIIQPKYDDTYNPPIYNYVSGIYLDKTNMTIKIGEKVNLEFEISPANANNKQLVWTSSYSTVVAVDNGVITAISSGTAVITVKTVEGGFTASCTVNVEEDKIKVTGVSLDKDTASITVGESILIKAQIIPENANSKEVVWSLSNNEIASVDVNGRITALKAGKAIITVKTADGGYEDSFTVDIIANPTNTKPQVVKRKIIVTVSKLNVRTTPTTRSKIIGSILKGQKLEYLGIENGWYKVVFNGTIAYVYSQYVSQIGAIPSLILKQVIVTAKSGLTIRDKAQADGRRIGLLRYGTKINAIELVNGWYKIVFNGRTGYISSKYVK